MNERGAQNVESTEVCADLLKILYKYEEGFVWGSICTNGVVLSRVVESET